MSQPNREQFQQAAALIKDGKRAEATKMLVPLLKADPNNASGWWLMVNAVSDSEHKKRALKRFLQLRPDDEKAKAMLLKLEPPINYDPLDDADNPFVAAKRTDTFSAVQSATPQAEDDPFGDFEEGDADPFSDSGKKSARRQSQTSAQRAAQTTSKNSGGGWLTLAGVTLLAMIVVGAVAMFVASRNANSSVSDDAFIAAQFRCGANESYDITRDFGIGTLLSTTETSPQGTVDFGQMKLGIFPGDADESKEHHFTFSAQEGQRVVIEITVLDEEVDPEIMVYDINDLRIAWCNDTNSLINAYMEIVIPRSGVYTIEVRAFYTLAGTYELTLQEG
jgi:hypothetical protein